MIKLVVTDLDGTLLDSQGKLSQANLDAVARLAEMGIPTVAATARSPRTTRHVWSKAGLGRQAICANGALVFDMHADKVLSDAVIGSQIAHRVISFIRAEFPAAIMAGEQLEDFYPEPGFFRAPVIDLDVAEIHDLDKHVDAGMHKMIARVEGISSELLRDHLGEYLSTMVDVTISGPDWIEFGPHGVSKATGVQHLCELLGIEARDVAAVGDQRNDLTMLKYVGHPLTVANAHPDVKAIAETILPDNNSSGFSGIVDYVSELEDN